MTANKKVLLTGYTGFLGRQTYMALRAAGVDVILAGRQLYAPNDDCTYVELDLNRPDTIFALEHKLKPDSIIHLASRIGWSGETDGDLYVPNVLATGCLAALARIWETKVVFSSAAIIHGASIASINSQSPILADTAYAKSKLLAEQLLLASGVEHCILRLGGLYGLNGPDHLGINRAIQKAINGDAPVIVGSGKAKRNYIYVKDAATAIVKALDEDNKGTHLVAGSEIIEIKQMLSQVCEVFLSERAPDTESGHNAADQVIEPSTAFPITRSFKEALLDIACDAQKCG